MTGWREQVARAAALLVALSVLSGCRTAAMRQTAQPASDAHRLALSAQLADSVYTERVSANAMLHTIVNQRAPWRAYVLEVEARPCVNARAVKGAPTAEGRLTTSQLLRTLPDTVNAIAAVNADFFLFAPPGVPTNLHLEQGRVVAGPGPNPVFWNDEHSGMHIDTLVARGDVRSSRGTIPLTSWNRPTVRRIGIVDASWGIPFDSTMRQSRVLRLAPISTATSTYRVLAPTTSSLALARGDTLLLHLPPEGSGALPENLVPQSGDTVTVQRALSLRGASATAAVRALNAVGGRPILLADSAVVPDVDTEGNAGFRGLNPRTAVGIDRAGRRLWLAVIDGRQTGYSMGMTLRQTAELMQAVGATRALNLDGGGSSAMVLRDTETGATRTVNRPSDAGGERPVANVLAVSTTCTRR
jgi:hypothetical protein